MTMIRRRSKRWLVTSVLIAVAVAAVVSYVRRLVRGVENAYAVWNVADLVIDHMEAHNGQWPRNWGDLAAAKQQRAGRDVSEDMAHYRELVAVDFTVDPATLARTPFRPGSKEPPFRVIRHRRSPAWVYGGQEPNGMIWGYLNGGYRSGDGGTSRPSTYPSTSPSTAPAAMDGPLY